MNRPADEDGYALWLRYAPPEGAEKLASCHERLCSIVLMADSATLRVAAAELRRGLSGLLGRDVPLATDADAEGALLLGTRGAPVLAPFEAAKGTPELGREGFLLQALTEGGATRTGIVGGSDAAVLYGVFHLLRLLQSGADITQLSLSSRPKISLRLLEHWDNLDRTVERGYAGMSLWDWHALPHYVDPRYTDYARACASLGINGCVLANADALVLSEPWIEKVAALARVFRPYALRVYLAARISAPTELDGLATADPREKDVQGWWRRRVDGIYRRIPDFGGFVVNASPEGEPGPQGYGGSHAEGANLLADALAEHGGVLIWRAGATEEAQGDRATRAYNELVPLDGRFRRNVMLQVMNGPLGFMPREPHHPLFGAMPNTALMLAFQLTQEYLGHATHLCYLGTLFEECLRSDTHAEGGGSTVAAIVDGSLYDEPLTGMSAVANVGSVRNWCGHPCAAANWYAFGRMSWDHELSARDVAEEWLRLTFSNDPRFVEPALEILLASREAVVDYMAPLGLHHQVAQHHHYGPGPWVAEGRADWTSVYYHRADAQGIGFDRTPTGSNAVEQYLDPLRRLWSNPKKCPQELLLWFHHVAWSAPMSSGDSLWHELCHRYQRGVDAVRAMQAIWTRLEPLLDAARFEHVRHLLAIQEREARWWRDACVLYFQTFSRLPLPEGYEPAEKTLEEYRALRHYYVPGISNPFVARVPGRSDPTRSQ